MSYLKAIGVFGALALTACSTIHAPEVATYTGGDAGPPVVIYVIKRSWHTDIGFAAADLHSPLASVRTNLSGVRYVLFGFGDRHYLLNRGSRASSLVGALFPGAGLVLLTALKATPEEAFGADAVIRLRLSARQERALEDFVWKTLATTNGSTSVLAPGPYGGSYYYASTTRYSGLHTCNTWTAEGLRAAGLNIRSFGVEFSGQVWRQAQRIELESGDALTGSASPAH
jgi:uncharacterized protein (TIGR02117 family)